MYGDLVGRRVIISSAGSRLAYLAAERFAQHGAHVFLWDDDARRLGDTVRDLALGGAMVGGARVDIHEDSSLRRAARRSVDELGGVDILLNAFVADGDDMTILETDLEQWRRLITHDLLSPYAVTRALLPTMLASGGGSVVNVTPADVLGTRNTALRHLAIGLTTQLQVEYSGRGVRATAIVPDAGVATADEELVRRALAFTTEADAAPARRPPDRRRA